MTSCNFLARLIVALLWLFARAEGFVTRPAICAPTFLAIRTMTARYASDNANNSNSNGGRPRRRNPNNDASSHNDGDEIPQLPSFGGSSFDATAAVSRKFNDLPDEQRMVVDRKFELQYTCKVCDTRNSHKVSRIAYNKGVVITVCKGCMSQHLISDHLGFTQQFDGNLEDLMKEKGEGEEVQRVTEEVFQLEKILRLDSDSGSILGPDGKPQME